MPRYELHTETGWTPLADVDVPITGRITTIRPRLPPAPGERCNADTRDDTPCQLPSIEHGRCWLDPHQSQGWRATPENTPYPDGIPAYVPGDVRAVDFDAGDGGHHAERVRDDLRDAVRPGVPIDQADAERPFIGYKTAGESTAYTVRTDERQQLVVAVEAASPNADAKLAVAIDGEVVGRTRVETADWTDWAWRSVGEATIDGGTHVLRVRATGAAANLRTVRVTTGYGNEPFGSDYGV